MSGNAVVMLTYQTLVTVLSLFGLSERLQRLPDSSLSVSMSRLPGVGCQNSQLFPLYHDDIHEYDSTSISWSR